MDAHSKQPAEKSTLPLKRRALLAVVLPLWVVVGFILAQIVLAITVEILNSFGVPFEGVNPSVLNAVVAAIVYALTIAIVIGVPLKWRRLQTTREELGLTRLPSWLDIGLAPVGFVVYMLLAGILLAAVTEMFPGFDADEAQDVGFENLSYYYEYVLAFVTLVVVAPIAEEVLLRGYLYGKLRKATSVATALIISSVLFSIMHFQLNVALNVLPLGVVLVVLREMTGSIWAGILLHMLKNGIAYYLLFVDPSFMDTIGG